MGVEGRKCRGGTSVFFIGGDFLCGRLGGRWARGLRGDVVLLRGRGGWGRERGGEGVPRRASEFLLLFIEL